MATAEYVEMASTLRELYDRAVERGYTRGDIEHAAAAGDPAADARMLGLTKAEAARTTGRLESLRARLEEKYPGPAASAALGGIEAVGGDGMNQTAAAGCRWIPALSTLYNCSRNGTLTTYIRCALVSWSTYCDDLDFTDFLEGVGPASDALGGGGGGAY
jgi:hypothetical protein